MSKKCQCRDRIRTNPDGTCVSSGDMCKSCITAEQEKVDAKVVVDQTIESDISVDAKVEVKPITLIKKEQPGMTEHPTSVFKKPTPKTKETIVPFTSEERRKS